jgi:hypothetical protein
MAGDRVSTTFTAHLRADGCLGDILQHPAFAGFAPLLLPWDNRRYDAAMPLKNLGSLLPYHTHVNPVVVVSLNRMIDDAGDGEAIFYDVYTDAQKHAEPSRNDTGLFFFRGTRGAPFAVVGRCGAAATWNRRGVSEVPRCGTRLRPWSRNERRRLD